MKAYRTDSGGKVVGRWKQEYDDHIRWWDSLDSGHNHKNLANVYDHHIPASTFLPEIHSTGCRNYYLESNFLKS
jgi:hypothetical protein